MMTAQLQLNRVSRAASLTERDLGLLRRIARGQVLSLHQVQQLFWRKRDGQLATIATVRNRLAQLVGSGYLETGFTNARKPGEQVYWLTRPGIFLLTPIERQRCTLGMPASNKMRESLDAQDTWAKLETTLATQGTRLVDWRSERELRSDWGRMVRQLERKKGRPLSKTELNGLPEIADAEALVEKLDSGATYRFSIEVDGHYQGAYLAKKMAGLQRLYQQTSQLIIYATSGGTGRVHRLEKEVRDVGASGHIVILSIRELCR